MYYMMDVKSTISDAQKKALETENRRYQRLVRKLGTPQS